MLKRLHPSFRPLFVQLWPIALLIVGFVAVIGFTALSPGCASTGDPVRDNAFNYMTVEATYTTTLNTFTTLNDQRLITLDQAREFMQYKASASRLMDQWHNSVLLNQPFDNWAALNTLLDEMVRIIVRVQAQAGIEPAH